MVRICVAGATGKMGIAVLKEAVSKGFQVVGAVEVAKNSGIGKSLRDLSICDCDVQLVGPDKIGLAVENADVYVTFTAPVAEVNNIPVVAGLGKRVVMGTTGFDDRQELIIRKAVLGKVPVVFSPNFSVGVNILFKLVKLLKAFPSDYDVSISEIHHTGKMDAPSGTAKKLGEIISDVRGYSKTVFGREGISPRKPGELEISALRLGGVPGIHDVIVAGPYEALRIEHIAFSRNVLAQGAVFAAEWVSRQNDPRIFSMEDVLGLV
jgi:4-hydroxy-tetrahydrodipicolinate reductase